MRGSFSFVVRGKPAAQGSKRTFTKPGGGTVVVEQSKAVKPWRRAVVSAAQEAKDQAGLDAAVPVFAKGLPLMLSVSFRLPRPKSAKAGALPVTRPDCDKLVRCLGDALTDAAVWHDDGQVVVIRARKLYAGSLEEEGASVNVLVLEESA